MELLTWISVYIGYSWDHLDEAALTGALDDADGSTDDAWFAYPLQGTPPLVVRLAQEQGDSAVLVRVEGAMDAVLAARIDTLLDVL